MGRLHSVLAVGALLALPLSASADIYQYTGPDGTIHFTNTRPSNPAATVYMKTAPSSQGAGVPRPGVVPFSPQDRDPSRYVRYDEHIRQAAALYQIPEQLVRAVIKVESDYDARAISYAGARGLMQLMPETAERLGVKDIHDPRENIFGGVRYLRLLANMFNGDLELTVAGYNAGENAVMSYGGIPPYAQTRDYVVKVTHFYRRYRATPDPIEASIGIPQSQIAQPPAAQAQFVPVQPPLVQPAMAYAASAPTPQPAVARPAQPRP